MRLLLLLIGALCVVSANASENVSVAKFKGNCKAAVSYTFDDGLAEHYSLVAPEMEKRGFRATFFINGSKINDVHSQKKDSTRLSWDEVREMSLRGHEMSNHGWAHRNFAKFPLEEIQRDIIKNDSAIYANTGRIPRTFAYPNNNKSEPGRSFVQQKRVGTRIRQWSVGSKRTLEALNNWVDSLIEKGEWGVGMTHGLTYGYDAFVQPQRFWDHLDYVKNKVDNNLIWVGTFEEIAAYVKARDEVKFKIRKTRDGLTITPSLNLDKDLFTENLTMIVNLRKSTEISVTQGNMDIAVRYFEDNAIFDIDPFGSPIQIRFKE